jgi:uncharacterized membrane protein (UPF0127 family)
MEPIKTIPFSIKSADSFFKRLKGLMFRKGPLFNEGLWITPCNSIHMCFMYFAIDAVFLTKEGKIVKLIESLRPWRMVMPVKEAFSVVELPAGTIEQFHLKEGERLILNQIAI